MSKDSKRKDFRLHIREDELKKLIAEPPTLEDNLQYCEQCLEEKRKAEAKAEALQGLCPCTPQVFCKKLD